MVSKYDVFCAESYKDLNRLKRSKHYELFISAYTQESMLKDVYNSVDSKEKIWIVFPDYCFSDNDLKEVYESKYFSYKSDLASNELEMSIIDKFITDSNLTSFKNTEICIDLTGFVKPYMIYLLYSLKNLGFSSVDVIYAEPKSYKNKDETSFSQAQVLNVRSINGFDSRNDDGADDLFIINAGYDHNLIRQISGYRKNVKNREVLLGFPSLQPIMYQENIYNLIRASDELGIDHERFNPILAPANDPFETARVIDNFVESYTKKKHDVKNIYLSPLATKPQALGMLLFYFYESEKLKQKGIDIKLIYPFTGGYSPSPGKEFFKVNVYNIEFIDNLDTDTDTEDSNLFI